MLVLFTDTDTDLTPQEAQKYGYRLISMPYSIDGKEVYPYVDFDEFHPHEFYQRLRDGVMPQTSAISPEAYTAYFEPFFQKGDDILYVHFSAAMSGTFNAMHLAVQELLQKYPERHFYTVDTKGITICSNNIVKEIGDLYLRGATAQEILDWADREVDKFAIYFYADNLKFFQRSGRVSGFSAAMGNLIGIKPIIYMSSEGVMTSLAKGRGRKKTLSMIVDYVENLQENIRDHRVIIGHTDALPIAQELGKMLQERLGELPIEYVVVNPTAGSHCGPDGVGVCFHAIHR